MRQQDSCEGLVSRQREREGGEVGGVEPWCVT